MGWGGVTQIERGCNSNFSLCVCVCVVTLIGCCCCLSLVMEDGGREGGGEVPRGRCSMKRIDEDDGTTGVYSLLVNHPTHHHYQNKTTHTIKEIKLVSTVLIMEQN